MTCCRPSLQLVALHLSAIGTLEAVVITVTSTGAAATAFSIALWLFGVAWIATALGLGVAPYVRRLCSAPSP